MQGTGWLIGLSWLDGSCTNTVCGQRNNLPRLAGRINDHLLQIPVFEQFCLGNVGGITLGHRTLCQAAGICILATSHKAARAGK